MNDRSASVFENYEIELLRIIKGRGALLGETQEGWFILKEYTGPSARLEIQEKLLESVKESGFSQVEQLKRNMDELTQYYRTVKLDHENNALFLQMIQEIKKEVNELKMKIA